MPTEDDFAPDNPLPLFLSGHADEHEQRGSSRVLKASILVIAATVGGVAITLLLGNPVKIFADVTASLTDISTLQRGTGQPMPTIQSTADTQTIQLTADAQASAPIAEDAPTHDQIAAASQPATQSQTQSNEPPSEALFRQFQAWAAKEDARAEDTRAQKLVRPAQDAAVQVVEDAPAPVRAVQKHRRPRSVENARAEVRRAQKSRAKIQREQIQQVQARPIQDPRAQEQPAQVQAPSFLQSLGLRQ